MAGWWVSRGSVPASAEGSVAVPAAGEPPVNAPTSAMRIQCSAPQKGQWRALICWSTNCAPLGMLSSVMPSDATPVRRRVAGVSPRAYPSSGPGQGDEGRGQQPVPAPCEGSGEGPRSRPESPGPSRGQRTVARRRPSGNEASVCRPRTREPPRKARRKGRCGSLICSVRPDALTGSLFGCRVTHPVCFVDAQSHLWDMCSVPATLDLKGGVSAGFRAPVWAK